MSTIRFGKKTMRLPASRALRIVIGVLLLIGGIFGFLPIIGFWMIPLGLLVLSADLPAVRRKRRQWTVRFGFWLKKRHPKLAEQLGFNNNHQPR